jgi:hypothetical protein
MKKIFLLLTLFCSTAGSYSQNYFYLSAGNSTIVPCNSTTTSVLYNVNSSTPGPGLYTVTLQPPVGGSVGVGFSANTMGHIFTASSTGIYTMTAYDGSSNLLGMIHFSVTLATVFDPTITASYDTICSGGITMLSFTPLTPDYTISPYNWSTSQTNTPISVSPTVTTTYSVGGLFTAPTKTCSIAGTRSIVVNTCSGIFESENSTILKVYPNPAGTTLYFDLTGHPDSELEIIDLSGRVVARTKLKQQVDISSLVKGVYCIKIISENDTISYSKFVKE